MDISFVILLPGYVGAATVAAAAWWFLYSDDGPMVTFYQLVSIKSSYLWTFLLKYSWDSSCKITADLLKIKNHLSLSQALPIFFFKKTIYVCFSPSVSLHAVQWGQWGLCWCPLWGIWVCSTNDHGSVCTGHHRDVQRSEQVWLHCEPERHCGYIHLKTMM